MKFRQIFLRPTRDAYFMNMVNVVASRGACVRRQTGCILVNDRFHIIATGYNGRPSGFINCLQEPCVNELPESGSDLDVCEAIHAEANALLQCSDVWTVHTAYCTTAPCIHCIKLLLNTSCHRIVFRDEYPHSKSKDMWLKAGREWHHWPFCLEVQHD